MMAVPQEWKVKRLGEIAKINMGQSPDSNFVNEQREGIAFLQGNAEFGEIHPSEKYWVTEPKKVADAGEILVSVRAPVGELNRADKAYCIGRGLASIQINKIDHEYGFYAFSMAKEQLNRLAQGSTFLAISKDDLDVISVLIPPKNEQQKIAEILSGIDRAIEATQTLIDKEKMIKKGLMADLLKHGIDEQGRIRTPQTHRYIESPLGMIPEGWEVKRLGEIAKINMGQSPDSNFVNEQREGIAFLQGNAEFGEIHPSEKYWVTEPKKVADAGEILVSVRAPVGQINRADKTYCIGRGLASIKISKLDHEYGFYAFSMAKEQLNRLAQGSTFLAISKDDLDVISILIPPKNEQQKIAQILSAQDRKIETEEANLAKLQHLKKGLMADLLSGKVRVKG